VYPDTGACARCPPPKSSRDEASQWERLHEKFVDLGHDKMSLVFGIGERTTTIDCHTFPLPAGSLVLCHAVK